MLYSPAEAAAFLRMHQRSLEAWRRQDSGPKFIRMGKTRVVYEGQALLDFVAKKRASTESGAAA